MTDFSEQADVDDLVDILSNMFKSQITLDKKSINRLREMGFSNPVELANFCFKSGWNEAVKVILQNLEDKKITENKTK